MPALLLFLKFMLPVDDGESCVAGGARVEKIRYPEMGVERCIASAALVVELYQPAAGDGGVAGAAPFEEIRRPTVNDGGVAGRGRAAVHRSQKVAKSQFSARLTVMVA